MVSRKTRPLSIEVVAYETEVSLFAIPGRRFTHAILNPPYKKDQSTDSYAPNALSGWHRGGKPLRGFCLAVNAVAGTGRANGGDNTPELLQWPLFQEVSCRIPEHDESQARSFIRIAQEGVR
jgi:hypothetical protein